MSTNNSLNDKETDSKGLINLYLLKLASTAISGWLGEMDGENSKEDWSIYSDSFEFDGKNSYHSFKKVFESSPGPLHYKQ